MIQDELKRVDDGDDAMLSSVAFFLSCWPKYLPVVCRFSTEFWAFRTPVKSRHDTCV